MLNNIYRVKIINKIKGVFVILLFSELFSDELQ